MENLNDLVKQYTIRHDSRIKKICSPLKDHLGISVFVYYKICTDGKFGILSTYPEQLEFFYDQKLYLTQPYLRHPKFFRSGNVIIPPTPDPYYYDICKSRFNLGEYFLTLERTEDQIEGFLFASKINEKGVDYLRYLNLLNKFTKYFRREAKNLIEKMMWGGYNLQESIGEDFLVGDPTLLLSSSDLRIEQFLKSISPLSPREQQCLEMYLQGHSAQSTAAILNLSPRTIEDYFENIKRKLNCISKRELI